MALDRRLYEVRHLLAAQHPDKHLDFYVSPLVEQWRTEEEEDKPGETLGTGASIQASLERILAEYTTAREGDLFSGGHQLASSFRDIQIAFEADPAIQKRKTLRVKWSMGAGNWARVPWIAMLDSRETSTTQRGVYAVILFRQDMTGAYVTLNQGVTEPREKLGRTAAREFVRSRAQKVRADIKGLEPHGYVLDDRIDLRAEGGLGSEYEDSTIAYKLYPAGAVPDDALIRADVEAVLAAYDRYLVAHDADTKPSQQRWWIFQANPAYFDLGRAAKDLSGLTWEVKQYSDEIKAGDRVFLWESGKEAGVVALATIQSDPTTLTMPSNEAPYVRDAGRFEASALRVQLKLDELLANRLTRRDLLNLPGLRELSILRGPQGTNFRVAPSEAEVLLGLISPDGPSLISSRPDLAAVVQHFSAAMTSAHLRFGSRHDELARVFISSLAAKRFLILTGLSGSGKTQLAMRFGEWIGETRHQVIAVRPDWTGPEPLLGYEDALYPPAEGARAWHTPEALKFMLQAASDPVYPYVLILDEMNLAHVERYFADILSGMESDSACLPNLSWHAGAWRRTSTGPALIRFPDNLFVIGTVNVDETTYMFSPKVLDRANTIEFRVSADELDVDARKPERAQEGPQDLVTGFLQIARDTLWHNDHPAPELGAFRDNLVHLHTALAEEGFEFGHRVFYEAIRFAAMLNAAGDSSWPNALDFQLLQKILPRLHGSRRRLEPVLVALLRFTTDLSTVPVPSPPGLTSVTREGEQTSAPILPRSHRRLGRMLRSLHANQFASFSE
jgi:MoxR-like ATPase